MTRRGFFGRVAAAFAALFARPMRVEPCGHIDPLTHDVAASLRNKQASDYWAAALKNPPPPGRSDWPIFRMDPNGLFKRYGVASAALETWRGGPVFSLDGQVCFEPPSEVKRGQLYDKEIA